MWWTMAFISFPLRRIEKVQYLSMEGILISYLFWVESTYFYIGNNAPSFCPFLMWDCWVIDYVASLDWMDDGCLACVPFPLDGWWVPDIMGPTSSTSRSLGLGLLGGLLGHNRMVIVLGMSDLGEGWS